MRFSILSVITLISATNALIITEPKEGSKFDRANSIDVAWTFVPTDPTNFTLSIHQRDGKTSGALVAIPDIVLTKDKKASIPGSLFPKEGNYTIYAVPAGTENHILAESQLFEVKGSASTKKDKSGTSSDSSTGVSGTTTTDSTGKKTTTVTVSTSKNSATTFGSSVGILAASISGILALMAIF